MDFNFFLAQMANTAEAFRTLAGGVSAEQATWKSSEDSWSILEVVNHLYDEEREDFRPRLEIILLKPEQAWSPIDPQGWVSQRAYNQRELSHSVQGFLGERQKSLTWLKSLESPDWQRSAPAPWGQQVTAGDMFAAWVAHDILHLRQLVELYWVYTSRSVQPYQVGYAGDW